MLSTGALVVALSAIVVDAIDNGLARTPPMGWVRFLFFQNLKTVFGDG
jgi:hypothetical protein